MQAPLAERLRPRHLDDYLGQEALLGPEGSLRSLIERGLLPSMILWGPPGVGKTSLAQILARQTQRKFYSLSAINSGVKEVREVIQKAQSQGLFAQGKAPLLFIDEIHRFSKSQQDSLLAAVEQGVVVLIGATTENPSFEVIPALRSRCQIYTLEAFDLDACRQLLARALAEDQWLRSQEIALVEDQALIRYSGGDARRLLNLLEMLVGQLGPKARIDDATVEKLLQNENVQYDKGGEQHYDVISAFIKSIRGSDPNAGVYWLARMIEGGEDPKFIARRLIILASEDIGLANPNALLLANACFEAVQKIGWPESRIILSQCVIYLANCEKSNSAYEAINQAQAAVKAQPSAAVPLHLRNAPTQLMKELGYGQDYRYSHHYPGHFQAQEYLPQGQEGQVYYRPADNLSEKKASATLEQRWPKYYGPQASKKE